MPEEATPLAEMDKPQSRWWPQGQDKSAGHLTVTTRKKQTSFRTSLEWCRPRTCPLTNFQHHKRLRHAALRPVIRLEPLFHFGIYLGIKARCIREFCMLMTYNSGSKRYFFVFKLLLIQIWISCWNSWKRNFLSLWLVWYHSSEGCSLSHWTPDIRKQTVPWGPLFSF